MGGASSSPSNKGEINRSSGATYYNITYFKGLYYQPTVSNALLKSTNTMYSGRSCSMHFSCSCGIQWPFIVFVESNLDGGLLCWSSEPIKDLRLFLWILRIRETFWPRLSLDGCYVTSVALPVLLPVYSLAVFVERGGNVAVASNSHSRESTVQPLAQSTQLC